MSPRPRRRPGGASPTAAARGGASVAEILAREVAGTTHAKITEDHWLHVNFLRASVGWLPRSWHATACQGQVVLQLSRQPAVPAGYVGPVSLTTYDANTNRAHVRFTGKERRALLQVAELWSPEATWVQVVFEPGFVVVRAAR